MLNSISGGRRRTASGKTYRKGTAADLWGMLGGYSNVGKYRVPPESAVTSQVP